jgi:LPXTG-motif cell wall-anchored protein
MTRGGLVGVVTAIAVFGAWSVPAAAQDGGDGNPTETTGETIAPTETTAAPSTAPETTARPRGQREPDEPGASLPDDSVPEETAPPQTAPPVTVPTENVPQPGPPPQAQPAPPAVVLPAGPVAAPRPAARTDLPVTGPTGAAVVGISALALLAAGLVLRRSRRRADEVLVSHPL